MIVLENSLNLLVTECESYGYKLSIKKEGVQVVNFVLLLLHQDGEVNYDANSPQWQQVMQIADRLGFEIKHEHIFYVGKTDLESWNKNAGLKVTEKQVKKAVK
jgi:hypothetical protein